MRSFKHDLLVENEIPANDADHRRKFCEYRQDPTIHEHADRNRGKSRIESEEHEVFHQARNRIVRTFEGDRPVDEKVRRRSDYDGDYVRCNHIDAEKREERFEHHKLEQCSAGSRQKINDALLGNTPLRVHDPYAFLAESRLESRPARQYRITVFNLPGFA